MYLNFGILPLAVPSRLSSLGKGNFSNQAQLILKPLLESFLSQLQMVDYAPIGTGIASSVDINLECVTIEISNAISISTLDTSRLRSSNVAID
ncbi:MAG TPA: hypothetical protein DCE56_13450 [Cyanobacteria bacterium UBA8553]|nr:hypothetical protein [Cyanobacteria bacterium UBA8553]